MHEAMNMKNISMTLIYHLFIRFSEESYCFIQWFAKKRNKIDEVNNEIMKKYDTINKTAKQFQKVKELKEKYTLLINNSSKYLQAWEESKKQAKILTDKCNQLKAKNKINRENTRLNFENFQLINENNKLKADNQAILNENERLKNLLSNIDEDVSILKDVLKPKPENKKTIEVRNEETKEEVKSGVDEELKDDGANVNPNEEINDPL